MLTIVHANVVNHRYSHLDEIWVQEVTDYSKCIIILDHYFSVLVYEKKVSYV